MTTITVLGGTGFAGQHLVREASQRGHRVISVSRTVPEPADRLTGVEYRSADVSQADPVWLIGESEVIIAALSPRGGLRSALPDVYRGVADAAARTGKRLFVVGGFSSLRPDPSSPRLVDIGMEPDDRLPADQLAELMNEASQMNSVLLALLDRSDDLAWTFFSPGMEFGAHVPGEFTGSYRTSDDGLVLTDPDGRSAISGADFAGAVLDELEAADPRRGHLAVAY